jgi:crotonobetainyl-CoA:carnitine CoA-transferase CaiB-like acyl-CoA transferase
VAADRIDKELASWSARRTLDDALAVLRGAGVPAEPVAWPYDLDQDEQLRARDFYEEVDHPVVGRQRYPGWPMRLSGGPTRWYRSPAPLLGQHTEEVLREELGLNEEELAALREAHVIGTQPYRG